MAKNLEVGNKVYVPCNKIRLNDYPSALYPTTIIEIDERSAIVRLPKGEVSTPIGTALIHRTVGICIISIGDYDTEKILIEPLSKSVLQFCRLIHTHDDEILALRLRSIYELEKYVSKGEFNAFKYLILIGHGSKEGIKFGEEWVNSEDLCDTLEPISTEKLIISLCCQTGYKSFSAPISKLAFCNYIIAPFHSIHGVIASQFCQTFLANHLLEGHTSKTAFNKSRESVAGSSSFKLWQKGRLQ